MDPTIVTPEELKMFHLIDRELYTVLAMHLCIDPLECMQVMGLWLWLERMGYGDIVQKMLALPFILINELADEAFLCINCIQNPNFASSSDLNDIPMIQSLLDKEISLQFFLEDRSTKSQAFTKVVNEVCLTALSDLMHLAIQRNATQSLVDKHILRNFQPSVIHPGFAPNGYGPNLMQSSSAHSEVPQDNRTMFVTFSKGYPVFEWEVRDFFTMAYGECIEALYMQEAKNNEQALFARIVFNNSSIIDMILEGVDKAKFTINGKHVWARKFVPKRPRASVNTSQSPPPPPHSMSPQPPPPSPEV
ncbi:hypothetical protein HS088_TW04G00377 [Tripterygium wilfordii]|uniref:Uncharacterized protein n=1 Tax=Tripterygium wilfordii TaxID=458696 RepID=A0A7J7DQ46_TRIWF|nr:uncharacterized protein LOC119996792 [Tripterygium wilfordii]KAF5748423.1 hypothetical protein HS088_TW04G00377 [Tripterygium wilfordii]